MVTVLPMVWWRVYSATAVVLALGAAPVSAAPPDGAAADGASPAIAPGIYSNAQYGGSTGFWFGYEVRIPEEREIAADGSAVIAIAFIAAVLVVFRFWRGGVALRATASDQAAAYSVGINVPRVFSLAWVASAMLAAISGIIVGSIGGISSSMGVFGLSVLVVVIVGGLDSVLGALVGGILIGLVEALAGAYLGGEYKLLATFVVLVVILMARPYGLFGTHEIERL